MAKKVLILFAVFLAVYAGPSDPEPRPDQWWVDRHNQYVSNTAANPNIPILFYGDSITEGWGYGDGQTVFNQYYQPLGVTNYGISADGTHHLLWRILNGEVEGLNPKLVVLKIGTNNIGWNADADVAGGVTTVVSTFRELLPNTKILLLGILPRNGVSNYNSVTAINSIIARLHDGVNIFYLDMFASFSESWGVVPESLFYDGLHLTGAGYRKWAETMNPLFNQLIV